MAIINSIVGAIILYVISTTINKHLPETKQIPRREHNKCTAVVSLIILGISLGIWVIFETIWLFIDFFGIFTTPFFMFGVMTTIYYFLYKKFIPKFGTITKEDLYRSSFLRIYVRFIGIIWTIAGLFITIPLLDIPIHNPDVFELGFYWAISVVLIDIGITILINKFRSDEKRIPKQPLKNAMFSGGLISFGIWSTQLIIFELYLKRVFSLPLYEQDIRVLIGVISCIYVIVFFVSLKKKFMPKAKEESKARIKKVLKAASEISSIAAGRSKDAILSVRDLTVNFYTEEGVVRAVDGVSFDIYEGEVLGLVGETGCGKSVSALSVLRLIRPPGKMERGKVIFIGEDLVQKTELELLKYRGKDITMIFQDPLNSLNPVFTIGKQISEVFLLHMQDELLAATLKNNNGSSIYRLAREWTIQLLKDLNIPHPEVIMDRYPHELSGGMRQRIQIAMGLACRPKLLIADEPTTALDVTIQNQILKLLKELHQKYKTTILYISHDLGIISKMCDHVAVMYSGSIAEYGKIQGIFAKAYHPYTRGLINSIPIIGKQQDRLTVIPGTVPNLIYPPSGCRFHPRCQYCFEPCASNSPREIEMDQEHLVACHLYDPQYKDLAAIAINKVEKESNKDK
ncbi:MAG: putative ABC-type peptide transport system, ATPase component 1 [Promethearchaeota archaeon CR_4]|nr:MAG: putative ABC-type peptide transport system, ATPase component 1 [Candidatus Lokiarchaeota archaeon CR_4]